MELPLTEVKKRLGANMPEEKADELFQAALAHTGLPLKDTYLPEELLELSSAMMDRMITELNSFDFSQIVLE